VSIKQVADRLHGANQACAAHPDVQLEVLLHDGLGVHQGREAGSTIVQRAPAERPDGAFCANDLLAVGVLQSLTMLARLRVPDDMRLVGYDDIDFASATVVPLTSIRQPSLLIGKTAVELLVEQIGPHPVHGADGAEPREVVFQPELIVRESTVGSVAAAEAQGAAVLATGS
jgi:LacI family transcriptional regulator